MFKLSFNSVFIIVICFIGVFLRVIGFTEIFPEYDDVGVIALQKFFQGEFKSVVIDWGPMYAIDLDVSFFHDIEKHALFPLFMAGAWTYSIGQFLLFPMIMPFLEDVEIRFLVARGISVFISSLGVLFFAFACFKKSGVERWFWLFALLIFATSPSIAMYSKHASPYGSYIVSSLVLILLIGWSNKQCSDLILDRRCGFVFGFLLLFSYALIIPVCTYIVFSLYQLRVRVSLHSISFKKLRIDLIFLSFVFIWCVIDSPHGDVFRGRPFYSDSNNGFSGILLELFDRHWDVISFFTPLFENRIFAILGTVFFVVSFLLRMRSFILFRSFDGIFIGQIFYLIWVFLFLLDVLPYDITRHVLLLMPLFTLGMIPPLQWLENVRSGTIPSKWFLSASIALGYSAVVVCTIWLSAGAWREIDARRDTVLDKSVFLLAEPDLVLTFGSTLGPALYADELNFEIMYVDLNSTNLSTNNIAPYERILLVSQDQRLDSSVIARLNQIGFEVDERCFEKLLEVDSDTYWNVKNFPANSQKNGGYVYRYLGAGLCN